jgi:hypothetical protein
MDVEEPGLLNSITVKASVISLKFHTKDIKYAESLL